MRDLLGDNIALHDQPEAVHGPLYTQSTPGALQARLREVPTLISWVYCFVAYMAVRTQDPLTRDMLAYTRLIIRKALRQGGQGWQDYDRSFWSQAAIDHSLRWNALLPDLQAATILGQRTGSGVYCTLCRGVDHIATQCALTFMQQPTTALVVARPVASAANTASTAPSSSRRSTPSRLRANRPICMSWNSGVCIYPGSCSFCHLRATCGLRHRARDYPDTPEDSHFKRNPQPAASSS